MRLMCKWAILLSLFAGIYLPLNHAQASGLTIQVASMGSSNAPQRGPNKQSELAIKNPQQAMQRVRSQFQAKVLTIQSSQVNGNPGYRVKLLTKNGEVFYVLVDAKTGAVMRN
jgi:uncharacterized membrane protein YkoI